MTTNWSEGFRHLKMQECGLHGDLIDGLKSWPTVGVDPPPPTDGQLSPLADYTGFYLASPPGGDSATILLRHDVP